MKVLIENTEYEIIKDFREGFNKEDFINRCTDYFFPYDFIVGDYAYGKLRLKGFYDDKNPKSTKINKYSNVDKYIKDNCAYGCKYFIAKKM
jgi:uncharacterized protein YutD